MGQRDSPTAGANRAGSHHGLCLAAGRKTSPHSPIVYHTERAWVWETDTPHRCSRRKPFNFYRERYFQEFMKSAIQIIKPK